MNKTGTTIISDVFNSRTNNKVCSYYTGKAIDLPRCIIVIGKPLVIQYVNGGSFTHELVKTIDKCNDTMVITTIRKIWIIRRV